MTGQLDKRSLEAEKAFWADPKSRSHFSRKHWEYLVRRDGVSFSLFEDKIVCEVGCGPFGMIYYASARERIGVDPLISYYREIGLLTDERAGDMRLINSGAEDLSEISSGSVDVAICFNVLDHVRDPGQALEEMRRILNPSGVLYLTCHVVRKWVSPVRRLLRVFDPPHPHHFSKSDLRRLLQKSGFTIESESEHRLNPSWTSAKAIAARFIVYGYSTLARLR